MTSKITKSIFKNDVVLFENNSLFYNSFVQKHQWRSIFSKKSKQELKRLVSKIIFENDLFSMILYQPSPSIFGGLQSFTEEFPLEFVRIKDYDKENRDLYLETKQPNDNFFLSFSPQQLEDVEMKIEEINKKLNFIEVNEHKEKLEDPSMFTLNNFKLILGSNSHKIVKNLENFIDHNFHPLGYYDKKRFKGFENPISTPYFAPLPPILPTSDQNTQKIEPLPPIERDYYLPVEKLEFEKLIKELIDPLNWNEDKKKITFFFIYNKKLVFESAQYKNILGCFERQTDKEEVEKMFLDFAKIID